MGCSHPAQMKHDLASFFNSVLRERKRIFLEKNGFSGQNHAEIWLAGGTENVFNEFPAISG